LNTDIRVSTSFKGHRKRKRLERLIGDKSDSYLIDLWLTVAMDCPDGILVGWDEIDIAVAVSWNDDPQVIVDAFVNSNWLEKNTDGNYFVHDWSEHQGWACKAKSRSKAAKKAADIRWENKRISDGMKETEEDNKKNNHAVAYAGALHTHGNRNAP